MELDKSKVKNLLDGDIDRLQSILQHERRMLEWAAKNMSNDDFEFFKTAFVQVNASKTVLKVIEKRYF